MRKGKVFPLIKKISFIVFLVFVFYLFLQIEISNIEYEILADTNNLINRTRLTSCISSLKGKNFWFTKVAYIKDMVYKCDRWIHEVKVDKKLLGKITLRIRPLEPKLRIKVRDKCFLMSEAFDLSPVGCSKLNNFKKLPLLVSKYSLSGNFNLLEQLLEFDKYCKVYLSDSPEYKLDKYAGRIVLVADFKAYKVVLAPSGSGGENFSRFFQAFKGLKKTRIEYKQIILLFDRVIVK